MTDIIHTCSSALVRPNGIVRYINTVIDLQQELGHHVVFATDSAPVQCIHSPIDYFQPESRYVPGQQNGHVWLGIDDQIVNQIYQVLKRNPADLYIAHDLLSYLAVQRITDNGIFIQHETDILTTGSRYSYMSDEWLDLQREIITTTPGRIGLTIPSTAISPQRPISTPIPFIPDANVSSIDRTRPLLYIGDASERKGAAEFMRVARELGVCPTVITHEADPVLFAGADVYSFSLAQRTEMMRLIQRHQVAYLPSKNECPGIVVLECQQYMPTIVLADYAWTQVHQDTDAVRVAQTQVVDTIRNILAAPDYYRPKKIFEWAARARQIWTDLSKNT